MLYVGIGNANFNCGSIGARFVRPHCMGLSTQIRKSVRSARWQATTLLTDVSKDMSNSLNSLKGVI